MQKYGMNPFILGNKCGYQPEDPRMNVQKIPEEVPIAAEEIADSLVVAKRVGAYQKPSDKSEAVVVPEPLEPGAGGAPLSARASPVREKRCQYWQY